MAVSIKTIQELENHFFTGDCGSVLKTFPDECIDMILTSPPYADKRNYGADEEKIIPEEYIDWFLPKAAEFYRVLKSDGSIA